MTNREAAIYMIINLNSNKEGPATNIGENTIKIKTKALKIMYVEYVLITLVSDKEILKAVLFNAEDRP
jgi:hypothetical protein